MSRRRILLAALALALLLGAAGLAYAPWVAQNVMDGMPVINDITTDTANPPALVALVPLRPDSSLPPAYPGAEFEQIQRRVYPDIAPARLNMAPAEAFTRAQRALEAMGLTIVAAEPSEGRIEAVAQTGVFRFKDDVVVRVAAEGAGARVDIRSKSRLGHGDLGLNAWRVRDFLRRLNG